MKHDCSHCYEPPRGQVLINATDTERWIHEAVSIGYSSKYN